MLGLLLVSLLPMCLGAGFDGIPGDYCLNHRPQCCPNRDDECTMPILGNHLCYCDMFCDRPDGGDCCPDFKKVCRGEEETPAPGKCEANGQRYGEGQVAHVNCRECTCRHDRWDCPPGITCLIQSALVTKVQNGQGQYSWQATDYKNTDFWGKTLEDGIKFKLGTLYPERSVQNMNEILIKKQPTEPSFDARVKWPEYIHPVRNQENCGSSWAFSTTSISADRLAIMSEGKLRAELSPQQLLSCNQHRQKGCEGGYLDRAWWYIRKLGVVSEECYPYDSGRTQDPGYCQIPKSQYKRTEGITCPSPIGDSKIYKMTPPYRVSNKEEDIKIEIMNNGPVQATFLVYEDFYMYKSGVYQHLPDIQNNGEGYHSVRILGWGEERGVKYWLCANSWGENWGESGLFKILRGANHCDIESFVIGAWGKGSKKRRRRFKVLKTRRLRRL